MQATVTTKRFGFGQTRSIVAAGLLVVGLIGFAVVHLVADDDTGVSAISGGLSASEQITFAEDNTQLPDGVIEPAASVMDRADMLFAQENLQLPGDVWQQTQSAELRFYEENTQLPADGADAAILAPEYRVGKGEVNA